MPGNITGTSNLLIKTEDRLLSISGDLHETFNLDIPKRGVVLTSGDTSNFEFPELPDTYIIPSLLHAVDFQHFMKLALPSVVRFSESSSLVVDKMTVTSEETTFVIPKSFDNLPFLRCSFYENSDKSRINKLFVGKRFQERIRFAFSNSSNEENILNKTGSIPIACFDHGFECDIIPSYYSAIDGSDAYISCSDYGRDDEKCIFINYGPNPDPGNNKLMQSNDRIAIYGVIFFALLYLVYCFYFVVSRACLFSSLFDWNCAESIAEKCSSCPDIQFFFLKHFSFIDDVYKIYWFMNSVREIYMKVISYLTCDFCSCVSYRCNEACYECVSNCSSYNLCEDGRSVDDSLNKIMRIASDICIEDHLYKDITKNLAATRKKSLLNNKLRKEMIRLERNMLRNDLIIPEWNNEFSPKITNTKVDKAKETKMFAEKIENALKYIKETNKSVDDLIRCCYNTITLYTDEGNVLIPIDGKPNPPRNIDKNLNIYSYSELRIIVQILLGVKTNMDGNSLLKLNTEECNWDYGDELDFKRTMICIGSCQTMLTDPLTGDFPKDGFSSKKLNCHELFVLWMKHLLETGKGNRFIDNYFHDRHSFVLFIYHYIVPMFQPTLPIGILELVDMTLADYERTPNMSTVRVSEFVQRALGNLHAFYSLEEEKLFRESIKSMYGEKLYSLFLVMDDYVKRKPHNLDPLILTSFDYIDVIQELSETKSRFLPVIYIPELGTLKSRESIEEVLNNLMPNSSRQALIENYEKLPDSWNESSIIEKKVVALSLLTGVFVPVKEFYDPDKYYNYKENMIMPHSSEEKLIQENIMKGHFNFTIYDCNPYIDYLKCRSDVPEIDQLIGYFFNHIVPNKKLFLPASIGTVFKSIVKGYRNVLKNSSIGEILEMARNAKGGEKSLLEGQKRIDKKSSKEIIKKAREAVPSFNIEAILAVHESSDVPLPPRLDDDELASLRDECSSIIIENYNLLKFVFNTIDVDKVSQSGENVKICIPIAGSPDWSLRDEIIQSLTADYSENENVVNVFNELADVYILDAQIALLSAIYGLPIDVSREAVEEARTIEPIQVKNIPICPATLHPFIYDRKTMSQMEISPESVYSDFKIFKYLKQCVSDSKEEHNFIPAPKEFADKIFSINLNNFYYGKDASFHMMPPNILDICTSIYDEYYSVVSFYRITKQQFLLIYEVCRDKQTRSQSELRFLKKEVADLVDVPASSSSSLKKVDSAKQLAKKGLIKRRYSSPFIKDLGDDANTQKTNNDSIFTTVSALADKRSASNSFLQKKSLIEETERKEKEKERAKLKRTKTINLKKRPMPMTSRKALKPMMKVVVSVSKKQLTKPQQEEGTDEKADDAPKPQMLSPFD